MLEKSRVNDEIDRADALGPVVDAATVVEDPAAATVVEDPAAATVVAGAAVVAGALDLLELPQAEAAKPVINTMDAKADPFLCNKTSPL
jgi:hypothetical protein